MYNVFSFLTIGLLFLSSFDLEAQRRGGLSDEDIQKKVTQQNYNLYKSVYKNALEINDLATAIQSIHAIKQLKPDEKTWGDTLTYLYFNVGMYYQSMLLADQILKENSEQEDMLEIRAISRQSLGMLREALEDYENLARKTEDIYFLYQVASIQYNLGRYGEAASNIDVLLSHPEVSQRQISITVDRQRTQEVPMNAAVLNMRGVIALEVNQPEAAKQSFQESLEVFPEFVLAQNNLKMLRESKGN